MSGTNRLINNENAEEGGSEEQLTKDLENANEVAAEEEGESKEEESAE